jgi:hypothetical protein
LGSPDLNRGPLVAASSLGWARLDERKVRFEPFPRPRVRRFSVGLVARLLHSAGEPLLPKLRPDAERIEELEKLARLHQHVLGKAVRTGIDSLTVEHPVAEPAHARHAETTGCIMRGFWIWTSVVPGGQ